MRTMWAIAVLVALGAVMANAEDAPVIDIGSRLEPFVDRYLVDSLEGARLDLKEPRPAEAVIRFDNPWEGSFCGYVTVIKDGILYHAYYRGVPEAGNDGNAEEVTCYAVSVDGIVWNKPDLGLYEVYGTRKNNIILAGSPPFSHNFAPFLDARPGVAPEERFKALAGTSESGLVAFVSGDGIHWRKLREEPVIVVKEFAFDSQNVSFWSEHEQCYVCYFRTWDGFRTVSRSTSPDFVTWSEPVMMTYGDTVREHLYTNQTRPYFRAPHIYLSIAARFMPERRVISEAAMTALGGDAKYSGDCSDTVLFSTRGGNVYDRTFMESFVRPGIGEENWTSRTNYPAYALIPSGESEMSFYINRNYGQKSAYLQRMTLRLDGFASVQAPYAGGQMTTKPLTFAGKELVLNYATSAAGSLWVELQDAAGQPLAGFTQAEADEIVGDQIERTVTWQGKSDVSALAGTPIRLRFILKDADLYSIRFRE
ncbi:MAG: hypothetical protein QG656_729 [Candidatus Hydrogenedentes bacterium]|nr:hypothetical protein [Candidatus Hydrogenedentota bacterium]